MARQIVISLLLLLGLAAVFVGLDWWLCLPEEQNPYYTGRQDCARCHEEEVKLWIGSDHDRAMDRATPETVLGNFDNQSYTHPPSGLTSKMFRRGEKYYITTDDCNGKVRTFEIKYTFGVRPLQQYIVELAGGRLQCLPIAWDTEKKRWFHLYPDEPIPAGDELHWTGPLQNWNYMCAECHSTDLQKKHDLETNTYHTTFVEIDVSCEACHGPGSLHAQLADSIGIFWDRRHGYGLADLKNEDPRVEIETCAPCHSRRRIVYPGFRPGEKFLDYYMPELLDRHYYYPDGQILEEDYVYSSFIQSRMYREQVRCTDCHDPHTARVKFDDNRLCGQCHVPAEYDTPTHHHHPDASKPGTRCVECHMPETTYMVVDPRRDHSIRVPRPDLTLSLKIPNACNGCHDDASKGETPEWAEEKVQTWYGKRKEPKHFAYAIAAGREGKPEGEQALLAVTRRKDTSAIVRASAILLLAGYHSPAARTAAFQGMKDPEALVRAASVRSLEYLTPEELHQRVTAMLRDPIRAVRAEAARVLTRVPLHQFSKEDRRAFDAALAEYMVGQEAVGDQAAAHLSMAVVHANLGHVDKAISEYQTAIRLDPEFVPVRNNLGMLYAQSGKTELAEQQYLAALKINPSFVPARDNLARLYHQNGDLAAAETQFRKILELEPEWGEAHYSFGLLLAEDKDRLTEAAKHLTTAAKLLPQNARLHYNRGLALQHLGRVEEAEKALKTADELSPRTPEYLHALAALYLQQKRWPDAEKVLTALCGFSRHPAYLRELATVYAKQKQWDRALACAEALVGMRPGDPQARAFLERVRQDARAEKPD